MEETCSICRSDRQKCTRSRPNAKCNRCGLLGYPCSLVQDEKENKNKRRKLSRIKCEFCRTSKQKCLPTDRIWPDKCQRCIAKSLPCSEPQRASRPDDNLLSQSQLEPVTHLSAVSTASNSDASDSDNRQPIRIVAQRKRPGHPPVKQPRKVKFADIVTQIMSKPAENSIPYTFQPLAKHEDTRLMIIHPGVDSDMLYCHLKPAVLSGDDSTTSFPKYEALSYYWGTDPPRNEIRILDYAAGKKGKSFFVDIARKLGNRSLGRSFYISSNLFSALLQLRSPTEDVVLWVDALCINQYDTAERSVHVARMWQIFTKAENLRIWLGKATAISNEALAFIPHILDPDRLVSLLSDESTIGQWHGLNEVMNNVWFKRRWAVQEISLAKRATVQYGNTVIDWSDFVDAVTLFVTNLSQVMELLRLIPKSSQIHYLSHNPHESRAYIFIEATSNLVRRSSSGETLLRLCSLETLVSNLPAFVATNPKDTIYAILSLAKEPKDILPDYDKSLADICIEFVASCVKFSESLDIICRHWGPSTPESSLLPSWILLTSGSPYGTSNEGNIGRVNADSLVGSPGRQFYNAAQGFGPAVVKFELVQRAQSDTSVYSGILHAKGIRIDKINDIGARSVQGYIFRESLEMGGLDEMGSALESTATEDIWRTLVADRGPDGKNPPSWYRRSFLDCLRKRTAQGDIMTNILLGDRSTPGTVQQFLQRVQAVIWQRKFFRSSNPILDSKTLFGLVPSRARRGDIICILFGCSVPVVLREHRPNSLTQKHSANDDTIGRYNSHFEFIGECYVHGIMDGEAHNALKNRHEIFNLK